MRLLLICAAALILGGCISKSRVYTWLDKHPKQAAEYSAVKFPPRGSTGETKVVRVTDTLIEEKVIIDSVACPDGSTVKYRTDVQYVVKTRDLLRVDTVVNTAGEEKERLRANEAEREVAIKEGELVSAKEKAKGRLYWIIGLSVGCAALFAFIVRKIF